MTINIYILHIIINDIEKDCNPIKSKQQGKIGLRCLQCESLTAPLKNLRKHVKGTVNVLHQKKIASAFS